MPHTRSMMFSFIAFIAGGILPLAFAPIHWFIIAFISPAILLFILERSTTKQAFWRGWYFGLGFFGVGASWVYISIHHFGNANVVLAGFIALLFIIYLACFTALSSYLFRLIFKNKSFILTTLFAFPALWVLSEWLRGWLFTGFPWLFLGDSQMNSALQGFAPIIGVYGVSFMVLFISSCLLLLFLHPSRRVKILCIIFIFVSFITGSLLSRIQWTQPAHSALTVSLIQGNISQAIKWSPEHLLQIMEIYKNETEEHFSGRQIIVWPEAAIPDYPQDLAFYFQQLSHEAKQHDVAIITGVPLYDRKQQKSFNGMIVMGNGQGHYLKRHLVPFGEYTPLKIIYGRFMQYFDIPMSDQSPGPQHQPDMIALKYPFATFICYEIAYPELVLASVENKQFIVVVSDDSWFGKSLASAQQLQMAQMRALETGRYILYSTNTGITAIVNPQGQIQQTIPQNTKMVLTGKMTPMTGKTGLMRYGYYPILGVMVIFLLIALI